MNNDRDVLAAAVRRACEDDPAQCRVNDPTPDVQAKAGLMTDRGRAESNQTLQLLITLMNGLEKFDGRKTVLLLSEGFLADESWPLVQQAVSLAARASARIYTLDARGLEKGLPSTSSIPRSRRSQTKRATTTCWAMFPRRHPTASSTASACRSGARV